MAATVVVAGPGGGPVDDAAPPADVAPAVESHPKAGDDGAAQGAPEARATVTVEASSATVESPTTTASSWSAGPTPAPRDPAAAASSEAERLAAQANAAYGIRIVSEGQDWGATASAQATNVQAVISAIDRLPDTVISAVTASPHGPLTFVSNNQGRTLDGWQPYGAHPMTYYTNSDQGQAGRHAANQVVLSVGAGTLSVGHEILHAYQARNVGADEYALSLLQPEMRSFMAAVGWRQVGSDEQVRQSVEQPWSALDALYVYEGQPLTYANGDGSATTISAANPFEAFAIGGSFYYTRPSWMPQPDWPEYWAWFDANLG
jgi:hypothetical protein